MGNIELVEGWTKDHLKMKGFHWESDAKEYCVVFAHGMGGNILENDFAAVLGETLSRNGIGFLYGHNRGHSIENTLATREGKKIICGAAYERFEECVYDIDLWVNKAAHLGYPHIILMGHSLGCNKVLHYVKELPNKAIKALILASPPNMVEQTKKNPNRGMMMSEAMENIRDGQPKKILSHLHGNWLKISSDTYLQYATEKSAADNYPKDLATISLPILGMMGEKKDVFLKSAEEDLRVLTEKATASAKVITAVIKGSNHNYHGVENVFAEMVRKGIGELIN